MTTKLAAALLLLSGASVAYADDQSMAIAAPAAATQAQAGTTQLDKDGLTPEQRARLNAALNGTGWSLGLGVSVSNPGYLGYTRQTNVVPQVFYRYHRFFISGLDAGYLAAFGRHYRLTFGISPVLNHLKASDSPQLTGIQERQRSLDGGVTLTVLGDWGSLKTSIAHDLLHRNDGTDVDLGYDHGFSLGAWNLTPSIGVDWQNAALVGYYYGVSPAEAIPGRPAYSPGSSADPYVSLGFSTGFGEHWHFDASLRYERFGSAIHDSPIVDRSGSPSVFFGLSYNERPYSEHARRH